MASASILARFMAASASLGSASRSSKCSELRTFLVKIVRQGVGSTWSTCTPQKSQQMDGFYKGLTWNTGQTYRRPPLCSWGKPPRKMCWNSHIGSYTLLVYSHAHTHTYIYIYIYVNTHTGAIEVLIFYFTFDEKKHHPWCLTPGYPRKHPWLASAATNSLRVPCSRHRAASMGFRSLAKSFTLWLRGRRRRFLTGCMTQHDLPGPVLYSNDSTLWKREENRYQHLVQLITWPVHQLSRKNSKRPRIVFKLLSSLKCLLPRPQAILISAFFPYRPWKPRTPCHRVTRLCPAIPASGSRETWTSQPSSSMMARMRSPPWPTMPPPATTHVGNLGVITVYICYIYAYIYIYM